MTTVEGILEHHGVKGMHWGIHRSRTQIDNTPAGETRVVQKVPGGKLTALGGKSISAHEDALRAATARQTAKNSGVHALSNQELQHLVNRMNMEQQYSRLATQNGGSFKSGHEKIREILGVTKTVAQIHKFLTSPTGLLIRSTLKG